MKTAEEIVAKQLVYPIKVSENKRYFVDQLGDPVFWLGTTQWQIFREHTLNEAKMILENVRKKGFNFVQAMLLGVDGPLHSNVYGEMPWLNDNPAKPNAVYFENVDSVIQFGRENGVVFVVGVYHRVMGDRINERNARP